MARVLVTGAAGFIGSNLVRRLLATGCDVLAIDRMSDYYSIPQKQSNVATFAGDDRVTFLELDVNSTNTDRLLEDISVVYHLAGQPGVRASWATGFDAYLIDNVLATQRLLESAKKSDIDRFVFSSSSSVYGNNPEFPFRESSLPQPVSPYGVTKLAAEHLTRVYAANYGLPTVSLRYFTVYGPGQRPDMATHRLINAALDGTEFRLFGDGSQQRDFTFVGDVVEANLRAAEVDTVPGEIINVAGGDSVTMTELIDTISDLVGLPLLVSRQANEAGDVRHTAADRSRSSEVLDWNPTTTLADGLAAQIEWQRSILHVGR